MRTISIASHLSALIWMTVGLITIGSIYHSSIYVIVNLSFGFIFICVGAYIYFKEQAFLKLMLEVGEVKNYNRRRNVLIWELSFVLGSLLIGVVFLTALWSRVIGEGYAVFG